MILADTNVVSEVMRPEPHPAVLAWAAALSPADLAICVVTIQEIEHGLGRLPQGRRSRELQERWQSVLENFADCLLVYDLEAAQATARVLLTAEHAGRPMSVADAQIAGISLANEAELATRNVRAFQHVPGLRINSPFT